MTVCQRHYFNTLFPNKYPDLVNKLYGHLIQLVSERAGICAQPSPMCFPLLYTALEPPKPVRTC